MKINLYLENKDNLMQSEEIPTIDGTNLDEIRRLAIRYIYEQKIEDVKYKIGLSIDNKTKEKEIYIIFEKDTLLLREFKLKKIFEND
jgi:hypothetical protein